MKSTAPPDAGFRDNDNMALGNPSGAVHSTSSPNNYLVVRPQFALSYNHSAGGPNWASWHLQKSDLGSVDRSNLFAPDPLLPPDWQIRPSDYQGTGYDRGHQCPSGDRTARAEDNEATFVMSNMLPQTPELNREVWRKLEEFCRRLVSRGSELYITCGGYGSKEAVGDRRIIAPARCWKVALVLPEGDNDLQRIDANTRVIAVDIPNENGIENNPWQQYVTNIAAIERASGLTLLSHVPEPARSAVKTKTDVGSRAERSRRKRRSRE